MALDLIDALNDPKTLTAAVSAVLFGGTAFYIGLPLLKGDNLEGRMKSVSNRREELRRRSREAMARESSLRHRDESVYKKVVDKLNLQKLIEDPKVVEKMAQAGWRGPRPISTYYFFRFAMPFVMMVFAAVFLYVLKTPIHLPPMTKLAAVFLVGGGVGFYAPTLYVQNRIDNRRKNIVRAFPDALDLLLICVESGMSIETAIQRVSQEVGGSSIELAEELSLLVAELSYLPERRMAYEGLARRVPDPGVKSVVTAMIQAEQYGTPLGAALRVMAKENRDLRLTAAEKKAAALPAKLTVPMILFFLPVLFVVIMGPAVMQAMDMHAMK
jgi:tight adherence protein C